MKLLTYSQAWVIMTGLASNSTNNSSFASDPSVFLFAEMLANTEMIVANNDATGGAMGVF